MPRYSLYQFDGSTFVGFDHVEQREIRVCSDYDENIDAENRARMIVALLNGNCVKNQK